MKTLFILFFALLVAVRCGSGGGNPNSSGGGSELPVTTTTTSTNPPCNYELCGNAGNGCYGNAQAVFDGFACLGDGTQIDYVQTLQGAFIWKEHGGQGRILRATGLWSSSSDWQKKLNRNGRTFSNSLFTSSFYISKLTRRCPTHVFTPEGGLLTTNHCVYQVSGNFSPSGPQVPQSLQKDIAGGIEGEDYLGNWDSPNSGNGTGLSWYEGNIKTCADLGMRLPTLYETVARNPSNYGHGAYVPTDANPTFSAFNQVDQSGVYTWSASAYAFGAGPETRAFYVYRVPNNSQNGYSGGYNDSSVQYVTCVLP